MLRRFLERPPVLEGGLQLDVEPIDADRALVFIFGTGHRFKARAAALTAPYPSGLRSLVAADTSIELVLVERGSRGLARAASEAGVGYLDLSGGGQIQGPGFVYVVPSRSAPLRGGDIDAELSEGQGVRPEPASRSASKVSPFARKASRVTRALLSEPTRVWRVSSLADSVRMNPGNVHRVLTALTDMGLVERGSQAYSVRDPGSLLEAWAENDRSTRVSDRLSLHVRGDDLSREIDTIIAALDGHAVVSGELAAELYAPYLPATHAIVHCTSTDVWDSEALATLSGPRPLRATNQVTIDLVDEGVADFSQVREGMRLVSPQQLYVDLYRDRTRAREAAEHMRRQVIRF